MRLMANWNIAAVPFQKEGGKIIERLFASGNMISCIHMKILTSAALLQFHSKTVVKLVSVLLSLYIVYVQL